MTALATIVFFTVLAGLGGPVGPVKAFATTLQSGNASSAIALTDDIYGYVYDSKGNKVPNAHVTLYFNGSSMSLLGKPAFSGSGGDRESGYYGFSGVDVGNYMVKAEIADALGYVYNGTAQVFKFDDRSVDADVVIQGYVYSPWIESTPTPEPVVILDSTVMLTVKPSPVPEESQNGLNPLYALAVSPVAIVGALILMRSKKRSSVNNKYQYVDAHRSQIFLGGINTGAGSNPLGSGFSEMFLDNAEYCMELEELVQSKIKHHYNDIVMINRVEKMAKKYGIDQFIVYRDIKRMKTVMERGRYR